MTPNPRYVLHHRFGLYPSLFVRRFGREYRFKDYVHKCGKSLVRWERCPNSASQ